jgi:NAD(P)-dependent dehydrogenase (short-subunit alcohol dehydrogenase family)
MLNDAKVLITGSARRVGRAMALELARAGCHVAIHYHRSQQEAEDLARQIRALGRKAATIRADLQSPEAWPDIIHQAVTGLDGLNILINNASAFLTDTPDTIDDFSLPAWESMMRVNLTAPAALCHHALPHLRQAARGQIINLSDISSARPWKNHLAYCVSKAGLDALTRALAVALAPQVTVNAISLGVAVFPESYDPKLRESIIGRVPMQRASSPEEVARFVRLILESDSYLTGQIIPFDGGRSIV